MFLDDGPLVTDVSGGRAGEPRSAADGHDEDWRADPVLDLDLADSITGRQIRSFLTRRGLYRDGLTTAYILTLSSDPGQYLRGRKRQALRTNLRKCDALGLSARPVSPEQARNEARAVLAGDGQMPHLRFFAAERHDAGYEDWVGHDRDGAAVGFARIKLDANTAMLVFLAGMRDDERSVIRYRLSADIFANLAARGVDHVILYYDGSIDNVDRYFAERLGFVLTKVRVARAAGLLPALALIKSLPLVRRLASV